MRHVLLALGATAAGIALHQAWLFDHAAGAALSDEARAAIEIRCQGQGERAADDCRALLRKLYLAGSLDPEKTLRAHCTPPDVVEWGRRPPAPSAVCVERYGGWQKG